jgi:hypothetical protein
MTLPAWYTRMNQRERLLATAVGGIVLLLLNLFVWSWIFGAIGRAQDELAISKTKHKEQEVYLKERNLWTKREEWLQQHQPVFKGPGDASSLLDEQLRPIATKHNILLENPQIGSGESSSDHQSVWASIETKSQWAPLVRFLYDVQQPEAFIVFENINLAIDSNDPTLMKGKFKIARWFAAPSPKKG